LVVIVKEKARETGLFPVTPRFSLKTPNWVAFDKNVMKVTKNPCGCVRILSNGRALLFDGI
jgi:hypothetical protein